MFCMAASRIRGSAEAERAVRSGRSSNPRVAKDHAVVAMSCGLLWYSFLSDADAIDCRSGSSHIDSVEYDQAVLEIC